MTLMIFKAALVLYLLGTVGYIVYITSQDKKFARAAYGILWAGFAAHSLAIALVYFQTGVFPVRNLRESLSFFAWAVMGAYLVIQLRFNIRVLGSFLSPLAAIMMISSSFLPVPAGEVNPVLRSFWLILHVVTAFAGNGIFAIAGLAGIMYLIQESRIKSKQLGAMSQRLPSLETLDGLNYQCLILGFPLLTIGLVSGSLYAHYTLGAFWRWDPKEVWSLITWLLYAALIHGRLVSGWRGRRSALLSILFFLVLVFSFLGLKFLVQGYHTFSAIQQG